MEGDWCAGIKHNSTPFHKDEEEVATMLRIQHFFKEIILPLAEKTNVYFLNAL